MKKPSGVLAIAGPTASGKSQLAMELAVRLGGEIISADAFAVYRGFDCGTAKPSREDQSRVPHHMIDIKDPEDFCSAGEFGRLARQAAREILNRGRLPILCGGTGFYFRTFFEGLFRGPERNQALREALRIWGGRREEGFLKRVVDLLDPESGGKIAGRDSARAIRYLEITFLSGRRPSELFRDHPGERWDGPSVKLLLTLPRPILCERITERFARTMVTQLPAEVASLLESGVPESVPAFSAIGYRETVDLLRGRISRPEWEEKVLLATRQFAKRQETWFRAEKGMHSLQALDAGAVARALALAGPLFI